eukprot:884648-Amphidinium_carterae.3
MSTKACPRAKLTMTASSHSGHGISQTLYVARSFYVPSPLRQYAESGYSPPHAAAITLCVGVYLCVRLSSLIIRAQKLQSCDSERPSLENSFSSHADVNWILLMWAAPYPTLAARRRHRSTQTAANLKRITALIRQVIHCGRHYDVRHMYATHRCRAELVDNGDTRRTTRLVTRIRSLQRTQQC